MSGRERSIDPGCCDVSVSQLDCAVLIHVMHASSETHPADRNPLPLVNVPLVPDHARHDGVPLQGQLIPIPPGCLPEGQQQYGASAWTGVSNNLDETLWALATVE
jgi:hypothetical protein